MAEDGIRARIKVDADEAIRDTERFADSTKHVGEETEEAGKKADDFSGVTDKMVGAMQGFAASLAGAAGINAFLDDYKEKLEAAKQAMEENIKLVRDFAQARLDLVALKGVETPEELDRIDRLAELSGRDVGEVARFRASIESQLAQETDEQKAQIEFAVAVKAQQSEAPLTGLSGPLINAFRSTKDARVASNILEEAIFQAGVSNPDDLGPLASKFVGTGTSMGNLSVGQAFGITSGATSIGLVPEEAITGFRSILSRTFGNVSPEVRKILERENIRTDNFENTLRDITNARQAGRISNAELAIIGAETGMPVLAALEKNEEPFFNTVDAVEAAESREGFAVVEKSERLLSSSDLQRFNLIAKQAEAKTGFLKATDDLAAQVGAVRAVVERELVERRQEGIISPNQMNDMLVRFDDAIARGETVEQAIEDASFISGLEHPGGVRIQSMGARALGSDFQTEIMDEVGIEPTPHGRDRIIRRLRDEFNEGRGGTVINNTTINNQPVINHTDPARAEDKRRNQE